MKKLINENRKLKGVTLIETLLYIGLVALMMFALSSLFGVVDRTKVRAQVINEVNQQGAELLRYITEEIRTSNNIAYPPVATSAAYSTVRSSDGAKGEITFTLVSGKLYATEASGTNTPLQLSNSNVVVSGLSFTNASQTSTYGSIKFQFTLSHVNPNNQSQFSYSQTFYGTASTRY